jgi:hypothetical protein
MGWKFVCLYIFVILATLLPGGADGWDLEGDDTVMSQHADTPDRTGLSSEMSEFLDWAFENGLDFEVRNSLHFGSTVSPCIFDSQRCIFTKKKILILRTLQSRFEVANISGVGRGLVARRDFSAGDMLLAVPKALLITPQTAQASEMGRMFKAERIPDCRSGTFEVRSRSVFSFRTPKLFVGDGFQVCVRVLTSFLSRNAIIFSSFTFYRFP